MKNLHFKENIKDFLYDLQSFISIYDNYLHVFNYQKLLTIKNDEINLIIDNKKIKISGSNLKIKKMSKQELLIMGSILKVEFIYV